MNRECPKHNLPLQGIQTRYGMRYGCVVNDCTVVLWAGETSTPADQETRIARMEAHKQFDRLWREVKLCGRNQLYRRLAHFMGIAKGRTHIGMFSIEQCRAVLRFALAIEADPTGSPRDQDFRLEKERQITLPQ